VQAALESSAAAGCARRTCALGYCTNGSGSAGDLGIPSIILGPGDPASFHTIDESISLAQLRQGLATYMGLICRLNQLR